jgi:Bax protein
MGSIRLLLLVLLLTGIVADEALAVQPEGFRRVSYAPGYAYYPRPPQWGGYRQVAYGYPYPHYRQPPGTQTALGRSAQASRPAQTPTQTAVKRPDSVTGKGGTGLKATKPSENGAGGQSPDYKERFIEGLIPLVQQENERILTLRDEVSRILRKIDTKKALSDREASRLRTLARRYRVEGDPLQTADAGQELLKRIDTIPVSLAVAQAATESAWGRSRFAREANNLFGIWTYDESKGLVPKQRSEGKTHLVRKFDSRAESVRYYMHNLNSHPAYEALRTLRAEQRRKGERPDGMGLAGGLERYSAKGQDYIDLIRQVIRQNSLALLDADESRV